MGGQPVWLASVDLARDGVPVATDRLSDHERDLVRGLLFEMLSGVGNERRQRLSRMQLTTCLHRAATDDEVAALPSWFHDASSVDLAGGPVEILWQTEADRPSTQPCERMRRRVIYPQRPDLWIPEDCGYCEPCRARAAIEAYVGIERALRHEGLA